MFPLTTQKKLFDVCLASISTLAKSFFRSRRRISSKSRLKPTLPSRNVRLEVRDDVKVQVHLWKRKSVIASNYR